MNKVKLTLSVTVKVDDINDRNEVADAVLDAVTELHENEELIDALDFPNEDDDDWSEEEYIGEDL